MPTRYGSAIDPTAAFVDVLPTTSPPALAAPRDPYNVRTNGHWEITSAFGGSAIDDRAPTVYSRAPTYRRGYTGDVKPIPRELLKKLADATIEQKRKARVAAEEAEKAARLAQPEDEPSEAEALQATSRKTRKGFVIPKVNDWKGIRIVGRDGKVAVVKVPSLPPQPKDKVPPKTTQPSPPIKTTKPAYVKTRSAVSAQSQKPSTVGVRIVGKDGQEAFINLPADILSPMVTTRSSRVSPGPAVTKKAVEEKKETAKAEPQQPQKQQAKEKNTPNEQKQKSTKPTAPASNSKHEEMMKTVEPAKVARQKPSPVASMKDSGIGTVSSRSSIRPSASSKPAEHAFATQQSESCWNEVKQPPRRPTVSTVQSSSSAPIEHNFPAQQSDGGWNEVKPASQHASPALSGNSWAQLQREQKPPSTARLENVYAANSRQASQQSRPSALAPAQNQYPSSERSKDSDKPSSEDFRRGRITANERIEVVGEHIYGVPSSNKGSNNGHGHSAPNGPRNEETVFAGQGWVSPHPLSVTDPLEVDSRIKLPAGELDQVATMTYGEWQRQRQETTRVSQTKSNVSFKPAHVETARSGQTSNRAASMHTVHTYAMPTPHHPAAAPDVSAYEQHAEYKGPPSWKSAKWASTPPVLEHSKRYAQKPASDGWQSWHATPQLSERSGNTRQLSARDWATAGADDLAIRLSPTSSHGTQIQLRMPWDKTSEHEKQHHLEQSYCGAPGQHADGRQQWIPSASPLFPRSSMNNTSSRSASQLQSASETAHDGNLPQLQASGPRMGPWTEKPYSEHVSNYSHSLSPPQPGSAGYCEHVSSSSRSPPQTHTGGTSQAPSRVSPTISRHYSDTFANGSGSGGQPSGLLHPAQLSPCRNTALQSYAALTATHQMAPPADYLRIPLPGSSRSSQSTGSFQQDSRQWSGSQPSTSHKSRTFATQSPQHSNSPIQHGCSDNPPGSRHSPNQQGATARSSLGSAGSPTAGWADIEVEYEGSGGSRQSSIVHRIMSQGSVRSNDQAAGAEVRYSGSWDGVQVQYAAQNSNQESMQTGGSHNAGSQESAGVGGRIGGSWHGGGGQEGSGARERSRQFANGWNVGGDVGTHGQW